MSDDQALGEGVTMHQLRHRFATRAYADLLAVQRLLGARLAGDDVALRADPGPEAPDRRMPGAG
jgi:integrase